MVDSLQGISTHLPCPLGSRIFFQLFGLKWVSSGGLTLKLMGAISSPELRNLNQTDTGLIGATFLKQFHRWFLKLYCETTQNCNFSPTGLEKSNKIFFTKQLFVSNDPK